MCAAAFRCCEHSVFTDFQRQCRLSAQTHRESVSSVLFACKLNRASTDCRHVCVCVCCVLCVVCCVCLTTVQLMGLEEKFGAHNYAPMPVVLDRGAGQSLSLLAALCGMPPFFTPPLRLSLSLLQVCTCGTPTESSTLTSCPRTLR